MGQVLPVFAHCSEYGESPAWCGAQKPAWGLSWVSIFRALANGRAGLRGRRQRNPSPPPHPLIGGNWSILTRRARSNGMELGCH